MTVKQVSPEKYTLQFMAMATLFVLPAYTKREYVLSYDVLLDSKTIREYRFNIRVSLQYYGKSAERDPHVVVRACRSISRRCGDR